MLQMRHILTVRPKNQIHSPSCQYKNHRITYEFSFQFFEMQSAHVLKTIEKQSLASNVYMQFVYLFFFRKLSFINRN